MAIEQLKNLFREHKGFWTPSRKRSMYLGVLLIFLSVIVQIAFGRYSALRAVSAPPESDIFLDNLPILNLSFIVVGGAIFFWIGSLFLLSTTPKRLIFGIKAIALLIIFRAFFMNLTREGIYPEGFMPGVQNLGYGFYRMLTFQGNLFFSGHTGFPFLMALIFWDNDFFRRLFLFFTLFFGASVLFAHVHYSIDVFSAPFIVYGVFVIASKVFPKDYALFTT